MVTDKQDGVRTLFGEVIEGVKAELEEPTVSVEMQLAIRCLSRMCAVVITMVL